MERRYSNGRVLETAEAFRTRERYLDGLKQIDAHRLRTGYRGTLGIKYTSSGHAVVVERGTDVADARRQLARALAR